MDAMVTSTSPSPMVTFAAAAVATCSATALAATARAPVGGSGGGGFGQNPGGGDSSNVSGGLGQNHVGGSGGGSCGQNSGDGGSSNVIGGLGQNHVGESGGGGFGQNSSCGMSGNVRGTMGGGLGVAASATTPGMGGNARGTGGGGLDHNSKGGIESAGLAMAAALMRPDMPAALDINDLHIAVGHAHERMVREAARQMRIRVTGSLSFCDGCAVGKDIRKAFSTTTTSTASRPLQRLFADLTGQLPASTGGATYYLVLVDDYTNDGITKLMPNKQAKNLTKTLRKILVYLHSPRTVHGDFQFRRTDNGTELVNASVSDLLLEFGIARKLTSLEGGHRRYGKVERRIGLVREGGISAKIEPKVSRCFYLSPGDSHSLDCSKVIFPTGIAGYTTGVVRGNRRQAFVGLLPTYNGGVVSVSAVAAPPGAAVPAPASASTTPTATAAAATAAATAAARTASAREHPSEGSVYPPLSAFPPVPPAPSASPLSPVPAAAPHLQRQQDRHQATQAATRARARQVIAGGAAPGMPGALALLASEEDVTASLAAPSFPDEPPLPVEPACDLESGDNWKAPGNDSLPAELLKIDDDDDEEPIVLEHFHAILVEVWNGGEIPQEWKDATIKVLYKKGNVPVKIITNRLSAFCETNNILPEKQCGVRPGRSTIDMLFVVRRLQKLGRKRKITLYMCFDLKKAYDSVNRELLWSVLARAGIPEEMIAVIRQFHDGMQAWVRMDDGEFSAWFWVTQGLRQGCVLSLLLLNIFLAAVIEVVAIGFSKDDVIPQNLMYLEEETGAGARTPLDRERRAAWGMLYGDYAGVISMYAEGLAKMMTVIVEVFGEFGLAVSRKKTETLLMRAKEKQTTTPPPPPPPPLIIEAVGQRYAQTTKSRYLGGLVNEHGDLTREINHRSRTA
ncbi:unnamed protein product [Ectocarpus sp. CCAP 1310/34]|nr:unnamed protein product [Ectocarpus sp. CCAP 1310/34]